MESRWAAELEELSGRMSPFQLTLTENRKRQLHRYCSQLYSWNRRYALLSRQDVENVLWKHVAASLGVLLLVTPNPEQEWVDVGTGAGLPGLVLKIWEPSQRITLIDGSRKKSIFLQDTVRMLGLSGLEVRTVQVETMVARGEMVGRFDVLFARAVADLETTLREFGPLVRSGGSVVTFKGPKWIADVESASKAGLLSGKGYRMEEVLRVPWAPGHLLQVRKTM